MKKNVKVREILGRECNIEDAILLREIIMPILMMMKDSLGLEVMT